ncbi:hypothetical protein [Rivularia sp. UHCC 0363]|uniref:hypothetical protein n=1 Tax=Rivularia sp. UHCC 0363 TaxID=3110244 RepID=UPI002B217870|nr:hypothetical protein [Rivularia sp. UHCC 0363]MEA5599077.1 hypothetical protein [Rivularia sp. UHCC 0363]
MLLKGLTGKLSKIAASVILSRVVALAKIEENDWNLNIARYVQTAEDEVEIDVAAEVKVLKDLIQQRDKAEQKMMKFLQNLGYDSSDG